MKICIYEGRVDGGSELQRELVARAAACFTGSDTLPEIELKSTERGKRFIDGGYPEISISHSGILWVCAVSDVPCGIDIQETRELDVEKTAARFFTEEEQHFTDLWGEEGFFRIWVRKEAYLKCIGTGLSGGLGTFETARGGDLLESANGEGKYMLYDIEIAPEIKCAACSEKKEEIEIILL